MAVKNSDTFDPDVLRPGTMRRTASSMQVFARGDPERLMSAMCTPEWEDALLKAFRMRLDAGKRDAIRTYLELRGMLEPPREFNLFISQTVQRLGVRDIAEAEQIIHGVRDVASISEDDAEAQAVEWLRDRGYQVIAPGKIVPETNGGHT